jgi:N utilization substance protein B
MSERAEKVAPRSAQKSARSRSREFALQAIYQWLLAGHYISDLLADYRQVTGFGRAHAALFDALVKGAAEHHQPLAERLQPYLDRPWAEVTPIEKSILLIGAFELAMTPETPYRVAINESVELAKRYGGTDAHKYVNGVLDKFAHAARAQEVHR